MRPWAEKYISVTRVDTRKAWDEYGQRPWQKGYKDDKRSAEESRTLARFKAEWAAMQGPEYRGTSCELALRQQGHTSRQTNIISTS
jgi:hypothetical protein